MVDQTIDKQLEGLRKKNKEIAKQIKQLAQEKKDTKNLEVWRTITELKTSIDKLIKDSGLSSRYTLKKIASLPDEYIYQHPKDKAKKAYDKNEEWVKQYVKNGGSITALIDQANRTRLSAWKKVAGRKRKAVSKSSAAKSADNLETLSLKAQQGVV